MASTYAALLSTARSLDQLLDLDRYVNPLHKETLVSLSKKVDFIVNFLEDYSDKYHGTFDYDVGAEIRNAAVEAQDFMDTHLCLLLNTNADSGSFGGDEEMKLDRDLNKALKKINFVWEEVMKMYNVDAARDRRSTAHSSSVDHSFTSKNTTKNMVVGLDDDLNKIKERLYEDSYKLQIIPIVGMGGIGKTTLARRAYDDEILTQYFDICAWFTLSAHYQRKEILSGLLRCFEKQDHQESGKSEAESATLVYQNLRGRRYFIVIDDIWTVEAWKDLKKLFPDDSSGSRILLTTRVSDVAACSASSSALFHQMSLLNNDQSWKLLQEKVFGQESCPPELREIGKKIATTCRGLPLTIVVVAGLISTGNMTRESWEDVSRNISSREPTIAIHCSKILCLSYDWLPLRLKPCFLYTTAFPEDDLIDVSKLIKLWDAEGFLKLNDRSKCLEDVGEQYLEDLVNRSLILVSQKHPDGKLKTVGIHDLLREICITKAKEDGFLSHASPQRVSFVENRSHRVSIHLTSQDLDIIDSCIRSALLFSRYPTSGLFLSCTRLNILHAPEVALINFSKVIPSFINLRYIAFQLSSRGCRFPTSLSKLPNLQTVIACQFGLGMGMPYEILEMPKSLRHLITDFPICLPYSLEIGDVFHGNDLQTLEIVTDLNFTLEAVNILVNLKKLRVEFSRIDNWDCFNLHNLSFLHNLEELRVSLSFGWRETSVLWDYAFPSNLKTLTLRRIPFSWGDMGMIGRLPYLQVLEMMWTKGDKASKWTPTEGQFLQLKYFRSTLDNLVIWEVEKEHFPSLETLILLCVTGIRVIPYGIGEIDSLQLIELKDCNKSLVNSVKQIQEEQHKNGYSTFEVRANGALQWKEDNLKHLEMFDASFSPLRENPFWHLVQLKCEK